MRGVPGGAGALPPRDPSAPKIPCPFCGGIRDLVPSLRHPKVLVCDRPPCIYRRTLQRAQALAAELTAAKDGIEG